MMVQPEKLDFAELAEARVPAGQTMGPKDLPWRVVSADGSTSESSDGGWRLNRLRGGNEGDHQSLPTGPSHGVSDVFNYQTASEAPSCGVGLDKLELASATAPVSNQKSHSPTLSVLAKPHAAMPSPAVDPGCGLGLDVQVPPKAAAVGAAVAQPPDVVTSEAPSLAGMGSAPVSPSRGDYDRQLLRMIDVWPSLSVGVRDAIMAMAEASLDR